MFTAESIRALYSTQSFQNFLSLRYDFFEEYGWKLFLFLAEWKKKKHFKTVHLAGRGRKYFINSLKVEN